MTFAGNILVNACLHSVYLAEIGQEGCPDPVVEFFFFLLLFKHTLLSHLEAFVRPPGIQALPLPVTSIIMKKEYNILVSDSPSSFPPKCCVIHCTN